MRETTLLKKQFPGKLSLAVCFAISSFVASGCGGHPVSPSRPSTPPADATAGSAQPGQPASPAINITSPVNGGTFTLPTSITISVDVSAAADQTIGNVDFFEGTTLLGTVTNAPYNYTWSNPVVGSATLTATATDNAAHTTTSAAITISVSASGTDSSSGGSGSGGSSASDQIPLGVSGAWTLKYSDEFSDSALDTSKWSYGWTGDTTNLVTRKNNSQEQEIYSSSQVTFSDGMLNLTAIADQTTLGKDTEPYLSGAINSDGKNEFTFGYFEARVCAPGDGGSIYNWPAWWLVGHDWPQDGEIDIFEGLYGVASCHFYYSGGDPGALENGQDFTGCHVYGADWEATSITYYYDGLNVWQQSSGVTSQPMFLIFNNAMSPEGDVGGPQHAPADMQVDYVRVWQHP